MKGQLHPMIALLRIKRLHYALNHKVVGPWAEVEGLEKIKIILCHKLHF